MNQRNEMLPERWATGDTPARAGCHVRPLVDGHTAMLAMCRSFLSAKSYILLAAWDIYAHLPLVRGEDAIRGDPDSPQQRALIKDLRDEGLSDEAIALWQSGRLTVLDVLGFAASHGVRVGVLLWDAFHMGSHLTNDPVAQHEALTAAGIDCLLDDSSRHITHITQSLHQKCAVIDGKVAYAGGIDLTVEETGDYDRWDVRRHPCFNPLRHSEHTSSAHPWHDVHCRVEGPAVADIQLDIVQRWTDVAHRHNGPDWPGSLSITPAPAHDNAVTMQVVRTIPPDTYVFAPNGIATIFDTYLRAIRSAQRFIYIENQYLWREVFRGLDSLAWGGKDPRMQQILNELAAALRRGVRVAIVLPDHPNCGRRFTDDAVTWLREQATHIGAPGRLHVFTAGNAERTGPDASRMVYRPIYTHGKVMIVDDEWWTAGSANLNSRGMHSDAELNITVSDERSARELRLTLWGEHTQDIRDIDLSKTDPLAGLDLLIRFADENRGHVMRKEHMSGHLLPYLTEADGRDLRLPVHAEHGWLDSLDTGAGALAEHRRGRYI